MLITTADDGSSSSLPDGQGCRCCEREEERQGRGR